MRLWVRLKRTKYKLLLLPAVVICWLLLRTVVADHKTFHRQIRYDRNLQAKGRLEEVMQVPLPVPPRPSAS